jgi:mono/diheme cytochrome c family protein
MHVDRYLISGAFVLAAFAAPPAAGQLNDVTQTPNAENEGIKKSLAQQIGPGRGTDRTPGSSLYLILRDPFRSINRGRQLFQRKFTLAQGLGPRTGDGVGDIEADGSHGAGLADSCAACHGRPRGSAGFGGDVFTRPDSRDAPHLFGLGLQEMLADEITSDLRAIRDDAIAQARSSRRTVRLELESKDIHYGWISALKDGKVVTSEVRGVDPDLRVRPFFAEGKTISMREFLVGAFNAEMGLEAPDPDLVAAVAGKRVVTPSGMVLDGSKDRIEAPPVASATADPDGDGVVNEIPVSLVDHMEFYLLNYFKAGHTRVTESATKGRAAFLSMGCGECHRPNLLIERDRRVADVETAYDSKRGIINRLFATATPLFTARNDGSGQPDLKTATRGSFLVKDIFTDFRRHDLGPAFHERNFDGSVQKEFMTEALWGVGSTPPYGHDGRSINLREVILRHGGEALAARNNFSSASSSTQEYVLRFLECLVLFGPPDTASNLDPGNRSHAQFPMRAHGSIDLSVLFNNPADKE